MSSQRGVVPLCKVSKSLLKYQNLSWWSWFHIIYRHKIKLFSKSLGSFRFRFRVQKIRTFPQKYWRYDQLKFERHSCPKIDKRCDKRWTYLLVLLRPSLFRLISLEKTESDASNKLSNEFILITHISSYHAYRKEIKYVFKKNSCGEKNEESNTDAEKINDQRCDSDREKNAVWHC